MYPILGYKSASNSIRQSTFIYILLCHHSSLQTILSLSLSLSLSLILSIIFPVFESHWQSCKLNPLISVIILVELEQN